MCRLTLSILGVVLALFVQAAPADAQATRTWVSGVGDDANPCSRTAPCKTFAGAISKTAAGGEISVLDPGGFGAVTITKSITINSEGNIAGVLASGTNGIIINAGANDVVVLRGLDIDGTGVSPGLNGIRFLAGGSLYVQNCTIRNFNGASPNGFGIQFAPSTAAELYVSNTIISHNGLPASGGGVQIRPTGAGGAKAVLNTIQLDDNGIGLIADGTGGTGAIRLTVRNSSASGNTNNGLSTNTATTAVAMMVDNVAVVNNGAGVVSAGSGSAVAVSNSTITANSTGIAAVASGSLATFKTNNLTGNLTTDGTFTATINQQ